MLFFDDFVGTSNSRESLRKLIDIDTVIGCEYE